MTVVVVILRNEVTKDPDRLGILLKYNRKVTAWKELHTIW